MHETNKQAGKKIYHDGGWVGGASRAWESIQKFLGSDERLMIGQTGEFVLSRKMIKQFQNIPAMVATASPNVKDRKQPATQAGISQENNFYGMDFNNYKLVGEQIENVIERARWQIVWY